MLDSSISIYKNFQNLPQDIQQKLLKFEQIYKSVKDLPNRFVKDTPTFIYKAMLIQGDRYDYHHVKYVNNRTKLPIICRIHGEFLQSSNKHFIPQQCPECYLESKTDTLENFIKKAEKIYGNRYDYSKFVYVNARTKGIIICPIHGEFLQNPNSHLHKHGCPECGNDDKRKGLENFIKEAKNVHGDNYNYSSVDYKNNYTKVDIECKIHGIFQQLPKNHIRLKYGCPECGKEKLKLNWADRYEIGNVYLIECWNDFERFLKVGVTIKDVEVRYHSKRAMPYSYTILKEIKNTTTDFCTKLEKEVLKKFTSYKPKIYFPGIYECLYYEQKDSILEFLQNSLANLKNFS